MISAEDKGIRHFCDMRLRVNECEFIVWCIDSIF